jgi:hypothetical protein
METPVDTLPLPRHPVDVAVLVRRTEALLRAGVPLSLLLDLADEDGPRSHTHYLAEGGDAGWLRAR